MDHILYNDEQRSELEITIFHYVQLAFMFSRLIALCYFIKVAIKLMRNENTKTDWESIDQQAQFQEYNNSLDRSTLLTFAFLILEFFSLIAYRTIQEVEGLIGESYNDLVELILMTIGYMCANLALIPLNPTLRRTCFIYCAELLKQYGNLWFGFNSVIVTRNYIPSPLFQYEPDLEQPHVYFEFQNYNQ